MSQNLAGKNNKNYLPYDAIFESNASPLSIVDFDFKILVSNKAFNDLFNSDGASLKSLRLKDFTQSELPTLKAISPLEKRTVDDVEFSLNKHEILIAQVLITRLPQEYFLVNILELSEDIFLEKIANLLAKVAHDFSGSVGLLKLINDTFVMKINSDKGLTKDDLLTQYNTICRGLEKLEVTLVKTKNITNQLNDQPEKTKELILKEHTVALWDKI